MTRMQDLASDHLRRESRLCTRRVVKPSELVKIPSPVQYKYAQKRSISFDIAQPLFLVARFYSCYSHNGSSPE
jgi:hypothetical protein